MDIAPGDIKQQNKLSLAGAYEIKSFAGRLDIALNARGGLVNSLSVFFYRARMHRLPLQTGLRSGQMHSAPYRVPTLNELYYDPGGNASLKPEQGWNQDAGYTIKARLGKLNFFHDLSVFNRDIHDWIIWLGGAIWTPHNIAEVHSRGVETENNLSYTVGKCQLHLGVNTAYVIATTVSSYIPNDGSIGRQIPYTPRYNGQGNIGFTYNKITINYNETYTGYRFITTDESEYLPPYQTGNIQLMYQAIIQKHPFQLTAQCNNIWTHNTKVVAGRPMPGINWLAVLRQIYYRIFIS